MSKQRIIDAAVTLAKRSSYQKVTRTQIAHKLDCATGLVNYYCKDMAGLRKEIVRAAIDKRIGSILLQALVAKHPLATGMAEELKVLARASI